MQKILQLNNKGRRQLSTFYTLTNEWVIRHHILFYPISQKTYKLIRYKLFAISYSFQFVKLSLIEYIIISRVCVCVCVRARLSRVN